MPKRVTVHYRRLVDRNLASVDFQPRYDAGLNGMIGGRRLADEDEARITVSKDGNRMCLLYPEITPAYCFGEIAVFRDGDIPVAEMAGGNVHLRTIPLAGNEEAVRGSSYFMSRGSHVALIHHESSTRFVNDYVNWLMREPIGNLAADDLLSLQPLIDVDGQPAALREVKSLKLRAEIERPGVRAEHHVDGQPATFRRMIERQPITEASFRTILRALGMTDGSLGEVSNDELQDLEFELIVKKRERNRITPLPDDLVEGVLSDGLDRAAEFQTVGAKRRGSALVASYPGEIELAGAYYELSSVKAALWAALGEWANQGLI